MTSIERVLAAIHHRQPDRVPKGELGIAPSLRDALVAGTAAQGAPVYERELEARRVLGMDLINIHEYPMERIGETDDGCILFRGAFGEEFADNGVTTRLVRKAIENIEECGNWSAPDSLAITTGLLDYAKAHSDLFCMCQINGPISALTWMQGLEDLFETSMTCLDEVEAVAEAAVDYELERARRFLEHGCDAILLGEDIAYNRGMLFPPYVMDRLAWPIYRRMIRRIKAWRDVPVFMHTDGDINAALDDIVDCGFDGLQSLQPSANMDILRVKRDYGDRICLMGNLDLDRLLPYGSPDEVSSETRRLVRECGPGGGFILSSCNVLTDAVPPENALSMYRAAETDS